MFTKYEFKELCAAYLYNLTVLNRHAHIFILCYYCIDTEIPIRAVIEYFRRANLKVSMFPIYFRLPGFTNHILALQPRLTFDIYSYDIISYLLTSLRSSFEEYPVLFLGSVFIRGHLLHVDVLKNFLDRLIKYEHYFKQKPFLGPIFLVSYFINTLCMKTVLLRIFSICRFYLNYKYWALLLV